jgi:pyrroloquinoline quinone (PQQ) biosynthesis protein C
MLSRTASRISRFLAAHRGLAGAALAWFDHHSEVDIQHAEEGLDSLEKYAAYYGYERMEVETIVEMTLRENVFIKRYFGELTLARTEAFGGLTGAS